MNIPLAAALAQALFHFLWEGTAIAVVLASVIYLLRPVSAGVRYGLACYAMLAMLASFGATLFWFWPRSEVVTTVFTGVRYPIAAPPLWLGYRAWAGGNSPEPFHWVAPAWLLGVLLLSLRSVVAWIAATRLKRSGVAPASAAWQSRLKHLIEKLRLSRPVILLESYLIDTPVVIGFLKPVILVPAQLFTGIPPEHLEFILIHELAHIRRHDYLVNLLQAFVEDLLFYHPAVWWVSSIIRAEREHCCDDVVAATGNARAFAEALATLEQYRWAAHDAALAANGGHLMHRIQRLLGRDSVRVIASPVLLAGLLPVAFAIGGAIAKAQSSGSTPPLPTPSIPRPPVLIAQAPAPVPQPAILTTNAENQAAEKTYQSWLNQEVVYIISNEERQAFRSLPTDEEREKFIEQFWLRRDPTPDTGLNEYREEHYRRILYADQNFRTASVDGWKTDRGMIYIKYGAPDERDEHHGGGAYTRPIEEGGGVTTTYPFEKWRYRYIEGLGNGVTIEFVDPTGKGEYHMTTDPAEKDALLYVPGAGLTMYEQMGLADKSDRFTRTDGTMLGTGRMPLPASMDQFTRLEQFAQLQKPPQPVVPAQDAIESIVFLGTNRVPVNVLRNVIRTRQGDRYDKDAIDRDMQALYKTQRFSGVSWSYQRGQSGWIITFAVVEKP